ncbi:MAG: hypothetical protein CL733_05365 [Chloroflexi bacterium]|nr:hypothetical protein [Chloroflexota bacterium]
MQKGRHWRFFIEAVALCQSAKWWSFFYHGDFFQTGAYLRLVIPQISAITETEVLVLFMQYACYHRLVWC